MSKLKIYTCSMLMAKKLVKENKYTKEDILDITVKSGTKVFAPTWDMVKRVKNVTMSEIEYMDKYYIMMLESYKHNRQIWDDILQKDKIIFACYCDAGDFCHRILLAGYFEKLGGIYKGELI